MADIYEQEHSRHLLETQRRLERAYTDAIDRIYLYASNLTLAEGAVFSILDYPQLHAAMERELLALARTVEVTITNGIERSFEVSQRKLGATVNAAYYQNRSMPEVVSEIVNRPQGAAMEAFLNRKIKGLGLSDRVWRYANEQIKAEIEQNLFAGIAEGKSAAEMARDQKQYLRNNDALFRRVRNAKGKLVLSRRAKAFDFHKDPERPNKPAEGPGRGMYRSAYKNALRLTVTEINMAYRKADLERYRATPFITGYRIILSQSHVVYDICDVLSEQDYPLDFEWVGFHPRCLCICIPIMPDKEEFQRYQDALLRGEGDSFQFSKVVKDVPEAFKKYVADNQERLEGWRTLPYWIAQNRKFVPALS